jgi:Rrf2 family transcriptional regulator, iron-sulfur cluster assembly transcription factor
MLLTTKGRYAVMALVDMATYANDKPMQISKIADRQAIDKGYLEQIFSKLKKVGLIESTRGPGGGYKFSRPIDEIRIADIMFAVDESIKMTRCEGKSALGCMHDKSRCLTHHLWEELGDSIYDFLSKLSLDDVCRKRMGKFVFAGDGDKSKEMRLCQ